MSLVRSSIILFLSQIISAALGFLATIYFAHKLGPVNLGSYYLFIAVLGLASLFTDAGINSAVAKRISEAEQSKEFFAASIFLKTFVVLVTSIIIFLARDSIDSYVGAIVWDFLIITLVLYQYSSLFTYVLIGENKTGISGVVDIAAQLSRIGSQAAFVFFGLELYGLLGGLSAGFFVSIVLSLLFIATGIKIPGRHHFLSIFSFSRYVFFVGLGTYLYEWLGILVIKFYLPVFYAGVFGAAWNFSTVAVFSGIAIATAVFPSVSSWTMDKKIEQIRNAFQESIIYAYILVFPLFIGSAVLSRELLYYGYGEYFVIGWQVLIVLMATRFFQIFQILSVNFLLGLNKPEIVFKSTLIAIMLNAIGSVVLVYYIGFVGAAVAMALTMFLSSFIMGKYMGRIISLSIPREIKMEFISSLTMGIAIYMVSKIIIIDSVLELAGIILLGALIYFSILLSWSKRIRNRLFGQIDSVYLKRRF